jgi:6,7-dimethyl-8-ribityllumazine synthase
MSSSSTLPAATRRLPAGTRVAAVVSSYHADLVGLMLESAREALIAADLRPAALRIETAPGSFELPLLAQALAEREDVDAVLCFGLVLRGETSHNEHVARAAADGILRVSLEQRKPVLFGVLTCDDLAQARARATRARDGGLDKGAEVARAAIESILALHAIRARPGPPAVRADARHRASKSPTRSRRSRKGSA